MARTDLETLVLQLDANFNKFEKAFNKANGSVDRSARQIENRFKRMNKDISSSFSGLANLGKGLGGAFAAVGIQQFASAVQTAVKSIADIGDQATKLGLANQTYQELAFAAQLAGVETEALASGMKKLAINSSDAANGSGELGKIFAANGVSIKDANGALLSQTEILARVADLVRNAASEQDQAAIAQAAFGKGGIELMGLLEQGAVGVRNAMASASKDGIAFTDQQIQKAQEFDDKIDTLIEKISVGLKGSFLDAAIGAQSFAEKAISSLDSIGVKSEIVGQALLNALKYNPLTLSTTLSLQALQNEANNGGVNPSIPRTPANNDGKGSLPLNVSVAGLVSPTTRLPPPKDDSSSIERGLTKDNPVTKALRDAENARAAIADVISSLDFEADQLGRTSREQEIYNQLKRAGVSATSEAGKIIAEKTAANFDEAQSIELLKEVEEARFDALIEKTEIYQERQQEMRDSIVAIGQIGVNVFEGLIDGSKSLGDTVKDLIGQLASAGLQAALLGQGPLAGLFGSGAGGGLIGSLAGAITGGSSFSGFYANGGNIGSNQFGIVGEGGGMRHAEIVSGPATVTPVSKLINGDSGSKNISITVDVRGARGDRDIMAMVQSGVSAGISKAISGEASRNVERSLRG